MNHNPKNIIRLLLIIVSVASGFFAYGYQYIKSDGFYEQRLIQEQVFQLTGSRYLEEFTNDEEQYKALMNNALGAQVSLSLVPGVALNEHQIESLTNSIVWMVEREVTLDDGRQVKALVPVIYSKLSCPSVRNE